MHVEVVNTKGLSETEQDILRETGTWFVVQELGPSPAGHGPVWHASPAKSVIEAETICAKFAELFPDKMVMAVGFPRAWDGTGELAYAYLPDEQGHGALKLDDECQAKLAAAERFNAAENDRAARKAAGIAAVPPAKPAPAATGPDLNDHLYQNKVAFPNVAKAAEKAGFKVTQYVDDKGNPTLLELDPQLYKPQGGEGGAK